MQKFVRFVKPFFLLFLVLLVVSIVFRGSFFLIFKPDTFSASNSDLFKAFYLGLKFDIRVIWIALLPLWFGYLFTYGKLSAKPQSSNSTRIFSLLASAYVSFTIALMTGLFLVDFGYYKYLNGRFNATALDFLENFAISAQMVWETYPIVWATFACFLIMALTFVFIKSFVFSKHWQPQELKWGPRIGLSVFGTFCIFAMGWGKLSQYPLRWSEAFFSADSFVSSLSMNPIHYFFDTYRNRKLDFDRNKVRAHYDLLADYLGVKNKDAASLNFKRPVVLTPKFESKPNVVLIVMESFAAYKTGSFGNVLNPSPHFDALAKESTLFTRYFVPSEGTARSMFGVVTGVPDVNQFQTGSRNPMIVNQNTLINAFQGYERFYFLGGSANWGNIRGIFAHNILGLNIIEEGMFQSPRTDVWGISDLHLFEEANQRLNQIPQDQRFFAIIQTAGFHRPYTIPPDKRGFEIKTASDKELQEGGFISNDEYNSLRFSDYALGFFFQEAAKSPYFKNTLFVVTGDHGLPDYGAANLSAGFKFHKLARFHVPLLLYAPADQAPELKSRRIDDLATQPDILPTVAGITNHPFEYQSLGRNLFDPAFVGPRVAFTYVFYQTPPEIGATDGRLYAVGHPGKVSSLYDLDVEKYQENRSAQKPEIFQRLRDFAQGYYEVSKYLLFNNHNSQLGLKPQSAQKAP